jgi:Uma2 family endonuclease
VLENGAMPRLAVGMLEGNQNVASVADTSETILQRAALPPMPVCRLGVDQYEEMIRSGIIMEDDPVELLDGWLVPKMTQNPQHVLVSEQVRDTLYETLPEGWCVYAQKPVRLSTSMPEPDVMVVRGDRRQYRDRLPRAENLGLVVEVSDASLVRDQTFKKIIYAQAGIPCYWLVNLIEQRVEQYTDPTGLGENADYAQRRYYSPTDEISLVLDGCHIATIPVRDLLP